MATSSACEVRETLSDEGKVGYDFGYTCGYVTGVSAGEKKGQVTQKSQKYIALSLILGGVIGTAITLFLV